MNSKQSNPESHLSDFSSCLQCFCNQVTRIREAYLETGPGSLPEDWMIELQKNYNSLLPWFQQPPGSDPALSPDFEIGPLQPICQSLFSLCSQCLTRPEGLCFISGEAGLVPRRDLHDQFTGLLKKLQSLSEGR